MALEGFSSSLLTMLAAVRCIHRKIMILLCLSTVLFVLVLLLILKVYKTVTYWKNAGIPYESHSSYIHYFLFRQGNVDIFSTLEEYTKKYGHVYGTNRGLSPVLRVSSAEGIGEALKSAPKPTVEPLRNVPAPCCGTTEFLSSTTQNGRWFEP